MRRNPLFVLSLLVLAGFLVVALFAAGLSPSTPETMDLQMRLKTPLTPGHLFGTDSLGRDVLTLTLFGIRISLSVALSAVLLAAAAGSFIGMLAGYFGGWLDTITMRFVDMLLSIPAFFLALAGTVVLGRGVFNLIIVLALVGFSRFARVARGSMLSAKEETYVWAARSHGASNLRIILRDLLPNIISPILVVFSFTLPHTIMIEASLSFLGLGLSAETPSLGRIISDGFPSILTGAWWISLAPGILLVLIVLCFNTIADSARDILDVRN
jgi:peptide/nickel transport system permease protein